MCGLCARCQRTFTFYFGCASLIVILILQKVAQTQARIKAKRVRAAPDLFDVRYTVAPPASPDAVKLSSVAALPVHVLGTDHAPVLINSPAASDDTDNGKSRGTKRPASAVAEKSVRIALNEKCNAPPSQYNFSTTSTTALPSGYWRGNADEVEILHEHVAPADEQSAIGIRRKRIEDDMRSAGKKNGLARIDRIWGHPDLVLGDDLHVYRHRASGQVVWVLVFCCKGKCSPRLYFYPPQFMLANADVRRAARHYQETGKPDFLGRDMPLPWHLIEYLKTHPVDALPADDKSGRKHADKKHQPSTPVRPVNDNIAPLRSIEADIAVRQEVISCLQKRLDAEREIVLSLMVQKNNVFL